MNATDEDDERVYAMQRRQQAAVFDKPVRRTGATLAGGWSPLADIWLSPAQHCSATIPHDLAVRLSHRELALLRYVAQEGVENSHAARDGQSGQQSDFVGVPAG